MAGTDIEEIYRRHIRPLPPSKRLELVALVATDLMTGDDDQAPRSLLDLEGLGAEVWNGVDAQQYVDDLRREWGAGE